MAVIVPLPERETQLRRSEDECSVFFKFVNGKTLCMMVNPNQEDILQIKQRLAELAFQTGECPSFVMASKDMFLVWNGKPLDDHMTLMDYNISTSKHGHATVFCYQRNRGGCFAVSFSILTVILASILGSTCTCGVSLVMVPLLLPLLLILPFFCL